MCAGQTSRPDCALRVTNIGGISESAIEFSPDVTILEGRNATNRTSMLQAIMAVLGSDDVALKADADEGFVELTLGENTYTRRLSRESGTVTTAGNPYLEDPELAELFAFLLESNDTRRAVAREENLRDILMRPVDTDQIEAEIRRLSEERTDLQRQLDNIDTLKGKLPSLEQKRARLTAEIEGKRSELTAKTTEIETADRDVEETREEKAELETRLDELRSKRATLDDLRYDIETERETRTQLQHERQNLESRLTDTAETPVAEIEEVTQQLERRRSRKQALEKQVTDLQGVVRFNEEMLEDATSETVTATLETERSHGDVTEQLLPENEITCWTCGSSIDTDQVEATLEQLREQHRETFTEVRTLEDEIEELEQRHSDLQQSREERKRIERRLDELEGELDQSSETLERLQQRRNAVTEEIERIEEAVEDLEQEEYGDILDLHREANQLEYELGRLESERDQVEEKLSSIEAQVRAEPELESQLADVRAEIEQLRTKIERIEQETIEQFNGHMETVLDILDYDNLDRIWIERIEREVREGRRKEEQTVFELHVVRSTESGTAYEDTIDHLSESEREVTGLVFSLAGYLAHELYEDLPFMLLDSLEAIDADRLAELIDYFSSYTEYLVVALLPEDATKLDDSYQRITEL